MQLLEYTCRYLTMDFRLKGDRHDRCLPSPKAQGLREFELTYIDAASVPATTERYMTVRDA